MTTRNKTALALAGAAIALAAWISAGADPKPAMARNFVAGPLLGAAALHGATVTGAASAAMAAPEAPTGQIVQPHAQGVFFDRRPLDQAVQQLAQQGRPSVDRLHSVQVIDASGFNQPMVAMTLDIPIGWQADGSIEWDRSVDCVHNAPRMRWSAASPDGLYGIAVMPALSWQLQSRPIDPFDGCPAAAMGSIRDYLEFVASNARPNARVLSYRDRPDLVQLLSQGGNPTGSTYQAGELLIGYSLQGHEMRESLVSAIQLLPLAGGAVVAISNIVLGVRAPDGQLDFAFAERIRSSLRRDTDWYGKYHQWAMAKLQELRQRASASIADWHNKRMKEISMAGMTQRHNIRMDTIEQIGRINNQIIASRAGTDARMHENFKDMVQEVQPWRDPGSGRQMDLSIHYSNAWQLADGRQFLTNDHSFDPGRDLGVSGHRLEPVR